MLAGDRQASSVMLISQVAATGALNEAAELVKELAQLGWEKNGEVAILEEALNRAYDAIDDEAGVEDKETRLARFHDAARQLQKRRRSCRKALRRKVCTLCAIAVPSFHVIAGLLRVCCRVRKPRSIWRMPAMVWLAPLRNWPMPCATFAKHW